MVVTDKIPFISESLIEEYERLTSEWLDGHSGYRPSDQGGKKVQGAFSCNLVYDLKSGSEFVGTDLPLAQVMGGFYFDTVLENSQITLSNDLLKFATIALLKGDTGSANSLWEFISAMGKGLTIEGDALKDVRATFDWICYNVRRSSCTNTATDLTTLPTLTPNRLLFSDITFRIATDFSDALAATDKLTISKFSLKLNNNLTDAEFGSPENTGHTDAQLTLQPKRNGFREVTFAITLPRYNADTWLDAQAGNSPVQADLKFTDGTYNFYIYLPNMNVTKVSAPIGGPGTFPMEVEFKCFRGAEYNSGAGNTVMKFQDATTKISEELAIETDNARAAGAVPDGDE